MPDRAPNQAPSRNLILLALGGLLLVGIALRIPLLDSALFGDEAGTHYSVTEHGLGRTIELIATEQEVTPPFFFILAWLTEKLGDPHVALRIAPLLAGLATIPLTYLLGLRTVGWRPGLMGAALVAVSPMMIFFSTEARAYAVVTLLALLSTLALLAAVRTERARWWVAYGVCSLLAMYTHYTVGFVLLAQLAWLVWAHPAARKPAIAANLGAAAAFLPWFPEFLEDGRSRCSHIIDAAHPFGFRTFVEDLGHLAIGHPFLGLRSVPGTAALVVAGIGTGLAAVGAALRLRSPDRMRPSRNALLIAALAASPLAVALYSAIGDNSIYAPRNLLVAFPALAVGAGALVFAASSRYLRLAAAVLLVGGMTAGGIRMLSDDNQRPDYGGLAAFVKAQTQPGDPVVEASIPASPGPYQPTTVALIDQGRPPSVQPTISLTFPPIEDLQAARRAGSGDPCNSQFAAPMEAAEAARRAVALATRGTIVLLTPGPQTAGQARERDTAEGRFLRALPPSFTIAETRHFRGPAFLGLTVYVLRRAR